jgi:hypothetical protein
VFRGDEVGVSQLGGASPPPSHVQARDASLGSPVAKQFVQFSLVPVWWFGLCPYLKKIEALAKKLG